MHHQPRFTKSQPLLADRHHSVTSSRSSGIRCGGGVKGFLPPEYATSLLSLRQQLAHAELAQAPFVRRTRRHRAFTISVVRGIRTANRRDRVEFTQPSNKANICAALRIMPRFASTPSSAINTFSRQPFHINAERRCPQQLPFTRMVSHPRQPTLRRLPLAAVPRVHRRRYAMVRALPAFAARIPPPALPFQNAHAPPAAAPGSATPLAPPARRHRLPAVVHAPLQRLNTHHISHRPPTMAQHVRCRKASPQIQGKRQRQRARRGTPRRRQRHYRAGMPHCLRASAIR